MIFWLWFSLITLRLILLLWNLFDPFESTEGLGFACSYGKASVSMLGDMNMMMLGGGMNMMGDDDLSRAVALYLPQGGLPQGGQAPVNLPEGRPLTMGEEERLALVLNYHQRIGAFLRDLDATAVLSYHFADESTTDLVASTLLHKDSDLHDPDKLWLVEQGLVRHGHSSRYYFRVVEWVKTEKRVRNGELPRFFIIDDDGEG